MDRIRYFLDDVRWKLSDLTSNLTSNPKMLGIAGGTLALVAILVGVLVFANPFSGGSETSASPQGVQGDPPMEVNATGACKENLETLTKFMSDNTAAELGTDPKIGQEFNKLMEEQRKECPVVEQDAFYNTELGAWLNSGTPAGPALDTPAVPGTPAEPAPAPTG